MPISEEVKPEVVKPEEPIIKDEDHLYLEKLEKELDELKKIPIEERTGITSEEDLIYLIDLQKQLIQIKGKIKSNS